MFAGEALKKVIKDPTIKTILDIGCGTGEHSSYFVRTGKTVIGVDLADHKVPHITFIQKNFMDKDFYVHPVDCVWASHVLEHQLNVNLFLKKVARLTKPEGSIAITVPPMKHQIVSGHVTVWNAGLVMYNLVLAGISCKRAMILQYGYNVSVITKNDPVPSLNLTYNEGDIERLAPYFPEGIGVQGFDGNIKELNWR